MMMMQLPPLSRARTILRIVTFSAALSLALLVGLAGWPFGGFSGRSSHILEPAVGALPSPSSRTHCMSDFSCTAFPITVYHSVVDPVAGEGGEEDETSCRGVST